MLVLFKVLLIIKICLVPYFLKFYFMLTFRASYLMQLMLFSKKLKYQKIIFIILYTIKTFST